MTDNNKRTNIVAMKFPQKERGAKVTLKQPLQSSCKGINLNHCCCKLGVRSVYTQHNDHPIALQSLPNISSILPIPSMPLNLPCAL
jgi:hypothetical protein